MPSHYDVLPETMKALELRAWASAPPAEPTLHLVERPIPKPKRGEVLVRIAASPINPSDLMFLRGEYVQKKLPVIPGFEGSGTVVAASGLARALVGRRVACSAPQEGDGTWAEYMVTQASMCFPLLPSVDLEAGATLIVNPMTAVALLDEAKRAGAKAVVQTAAASALGRMLVRLSQKKRVPMIHVVRRASQAALLRSIGAEHVLDSSDPAFEERLKERCRELRATVAFDAVAGEMTGKLLQAMPRDSRVIVYGALSEQPVSVHPGQLIFGGKHVEGFWLASWIRKRGLPEVLRAGIMVQRHLGAEFRTEIRARFPLSAAAQALSQYTAAMTEGKVLFVPGGATA